MENTRYVCCVWKVSLKPKIKTLFLSLFTEDSKQNVLVPQMCIILGWELNPSRLDPSKVFTWLENRLARSVDSNRVKWLIISEITTRPLKPKYLWNYRIILRKVHWIIPKKTNRGIVTIYHTAWNLVFKHFLCSTKKK